MKSPKGLAGFTSAAKTAPVAKNYFYGPMSDAFGVLDLEEGTFFCPACHERKPSIEGAGTYFLESGASVFYPVCRACHVLMGDKYKRKAYLERIEATLHRLGFNLAPEDLNPGI